MSTPTLLTLDTTTEACSVALQYGDDVCERFGLMPRGHAQHVLGMADEVLAEAGIALSAVDAIGFCRGPGAFTGVRIAVGVVQGLAFGADLPVVPVSTLATLAQGAIAEQGADKVLAAVDARMGEVYSAAYCSIDGCASLLGAERVCAPNAVEVPEGAGWLGVGTGWGAYDALLRKHCGDTVMRTVPDVYPRARHILPLATRAHAAGDAVAAADALPVYLRDRVTG
ncbi:tRNA (adenosine(37)-N6)-threonylcarbamoyltransferase complex dimerization subunit type 1 TsaB [Alkalilimnicola ehrlichii]|uniref:tRNA threonylcarbamoyladenosine biosynthesis protein TsaB n=1 Tax=Alkalilimnicola ehrlichii TaxID=351052 RepID=A0A3E0X2E7_9GAMM|nr:tRNA (adenosine(37)-N6)-threonylcarbamoyltransferase complex dimerization subunit type 1 TsaB [Alkalilimnicola ehrlichii]RFA31045.1 tRNA (adenosine(37)-N6)-threonylcarbamoyltransferase complex dimerization subunit type 1 TsaB [Alkalilimnicola ehrlichii]RFA38999.1 tRNA (adenosine(37)-N6)-threonylcarbamoyltransferase complex dimerization subunit type 1 TsaB [Alkalilimnicola ehrlichii]